MRAGWALRGRNHVERFSPETRDRVENSLRAMLKRLRRDGREVPALIDALERVATGWGKGAAAKHAGLVALGRAARKLAEAMPALPWALVRTAQDSEEWEVFRRRLATLSRWDRGSRGRRSDLVREGLDANVRRVLKEAGLPFSGSERAAEILALVEAHAFGTAPPPHRRRGAEAATTPAFSRLRYVEKLARRRGR